MSRRCFGHVLGRSQSDLGDVSVVSEMCRSCLDDVSSCFGDALLMSPGCLGDVSVLSPWRLSHVSGMFRSCFGDSRSCLSHVSMISE